MLAVLLAPVSVQGTPVGGPVAPVIPACGPCCGTLRGAGCSVLLLRDPGVNGAAAAEGDQPVEPLGASQGHQPPWRGRGQSRAGGSWIRTQASQDIQFSFAQPLSSCRKHCFACCL